MTSDYREAPVGPAAEQYVRESLSQGHTLARTVLQVLPLSHGQITTFLPPSIAPQSVDDFRAGGKLPTPPSSQWKWGQAHGKSYRMVPVPNTDNELMAEIKNHLMSGENNVCILEDSVVMAGDPVLQKCVTRYAILGDDVYYLLFHDVAKDEMIFRAIRQARSALPILIGLMAVYKEPKQLGSGGSISLVQLEALVRDALRLFVGAYDGEGYLIWSKR